MTTVITPKLAEPAPLDAKAQGLKSLDASTWAEEIRARRGTNDLRLMEQRLAFVGEHPGWTRRWCNDVDDNIARRLEDGWRFVKRGEVQMSQSVGFENEDIGDNITRSSNLGDGRAIKVYLMEIPTTIAEEINDARSLSKVRAFEETVRRGVVGGGSPNQYLPGEVPGSKFHGTHNDIGRKVA